MKTIRVSFVIIAVWIQGLMVTQVPAETFPLPAWTLSGQGNGSWSGSSPTPTEVHLVVRPPGSGNPLESADAFSSTNILTLKSNTLYRLSATGSLSSVGPGSGGGIDLVVVPAGGGSAIAAAGVSLAGGTHPYSMELLTGGPGDPQVGANLIAHCSAASTYQFGGFVDVTDLTLEATKIDQRLYTALPDATHLKLSWYTNYGEFALEQNTNALAVDAWQTATNAVMFEGTARAVTVQLDPKAAPSFYRLRKP